MGTKVYSPYVKITNPGYNIRSYIEYSVVKNTDTQYQLSIGAGMNGKSLTSHVQVASRLSLGLAVTGNTKKFGHEENVSIKGEGTTRSIIDVANYPAWDKGHSAKTITVSVTDALCPTHQTTLEFSKSFTIPAKTSYTVTYNANGGVNAPTSQTKWYGESLVLQSGKPTRTDSTSGLLYDFTGWNTKADGTGTTYQPGAAYTGNAALTLYAQWREHYYPPTLKNYDVIRCDQNGNPADEGMYAKVSFDCIINSWKYPQNTTLSSYNVTIGSFTATPTVSYSTFGYNTTCACSAIVGNGTFDTDTVYPGTISVNDSSGESSATATVNISLSTANFAIDVSANGRSIGIFKAASDDIDYIFDVGGLVRISPGDGGRWSSSENGLVLTSDVDPSIHPSVNKWANGMAVKNADDERFAYVEGAHTTEGYIGISLVGRRVISGSNSYNYVRLLIDDNGNDIVQLDAPTAWMSALSPGVTTYGYAKFYCNSGFEPYSTSGVEAPTAIKFGRVVTLMGAYRKVGAQSLAADITIGKVPEGCQPFRQVRFVEQGSGQNRFLLQINPDRTMTVRRYGVASNVVLGNDAWINICCTYITES